MSNDMRELIVVGVMLILWLAVGAILNAGLDWSYRKYLQDMKDIASRRR